MAIRVGIIGRNFVVDWMLAAMEQVPELRPAAIYSRNEETGREFAKKYHLDAVFTDLEAFAASDAFDAAYIASPNLCHFDQAMCLLRHGKHVLLEKPGVLTRKQTETLVETANANHVVYLEAHHPGRAARDRDASPRHSGIYAVFLPLRPRPRRRAAYQRL